MADHADRVNDPGNRAVDRIIAVLFVTLALFLAFPMRFFFNIGTGIDQSWRLAFHIARTQGAVFGKDIVFTYGPLGFLSTRLPFEDLKPYLLISDVFLYANLAFVLVYFVRIRRSYLELVCGLLAVFCFGSHINVTSNLVTILFGLFVFFLFFDLKHRSRFALLMAGILSVLVFYIKLNLGLLSVALMLSYSLALP